MAEGTGCEAPKTCLAKIVMVGDSFVGKTSILRRYTDFCSTGRAPLSSCVTTVGIDFKVKTISCDNTTMKLQIWDTAGQERFHTFTTSFFRGAHGFVLVYDITDGKSFQGISHWMKDIYEKVGEDTDIILLGNKCDKEAERIISKTKEKRSCSVQSGKDPSHHLLSDPLLDISTTKHDYDCIEASNKGFNWDYENYRITINQKHTSKALHILLAWEYGIPFFETSAKDNINIENAFSVLAKEILNKNSHVLLNLDVVDLNEKLQTRSCCKL